MSRARTRRTRGTSGTRGTRGARVQPKEQAELPPGRNERDASRDEDNEELDEALDPEPPEDPEDGGNGGGGDDSEGSDDEDDDGTGLGANRPGALTPGQAIHGTLNYAKKAHIYLYRNATQALDEDLYDCTPDQFFQFMKSLDTRANAFGWTNPQGGILWVRAKGGNMINLIDSYGSISLPRIQRHEKTYWNDGFRRSQDDRMLFECLMSSLSTTGKEKLIAHSDDYMLKSGNQVVPSGLSLLKVIVRESYLDSNATTGMIREQLSNLEMFMPTVDNDITRFNNHVKMLLKALSARNERTFDLLTYLFKAYSVCNDKEFNKFISDIQTDHDMGNKRVDAAELMSMAEKKYKIMKTLNKWEAPSQTDERIMALEVELKKAEETFGLVRNKRQRNQGENNKQKRQKTEKKPEWFKGPPAPRKLLQPKEWNGHNSCSLPLRFTHFQGSFQHLCFIQHHHVLNSTSNTTIHTLSKQELQEPSLLPHFS